MELFPLLCQPDQDEKQSDASSDLYGSHSGIACRAGHGQFKYGSIHHGQPDEIPVILPDAPFIDKFRQELISLGRFRFRHAVETAGVQAGEPHHAVRSAGEFSVRKSFRSAGSLRDIRRIRIGHRLPLLAVL